MSATQFWLGELDQYGTASTVDGPHSDRAGVAQAKYLFDAMGFTKNRTLICMEVHVTEIEADDAGVNKTALGQCQAMGLRAAPQPQEQS